MSFIGEVQENGWPVRRNNRWTPSVPSAFAYQASPYATWALGASINWTNMSAPLTMDVGGASWTATPPGLSPLFSADSPPGRQLIVRATFTPFLSGTLVSPNYAVLFTIQQATEGLVGTTTSFPKGEQLVILPDPAVSQVRRTITIERIFQMNGSPIGVVCRKTSTDAINVQSANMQLSIIPA